MTLKSIFSAIGRAFSIFKVQADKVAPEIQREIDKIMAAAKSRTEDLKSQHSVQSIIDRAEADIKVAKDAAARHVSLIEADRDRLITQAQALLPPLNLNPPAGVQSA